MSERTIDVKQDIRAQRRAAAEQFRQRMERQGTLVVRLLSSPGAGKTTLLQHTAQRLSDDFKLGVLVGDVETQRDAERLAPYAPTKQITTGGACHLELPLVERALPELGPQRFDFLFIEDVGNLICPASHELGEHVRLIVLSTTEGDDKPGKYPKAFRTSQAVVISKLDLLPHVPFSVERAAEDALAVQPQLTVLPLCAPTGEGMDDWLQYLKQRRSEIAARGAPRPESRVTAMCLAVPALVVTVNDNRTAVVQLGEVRREVAIDLVPDTQAGDYVIVHVGFAIQRMDEDEALKTLAALDELAEAHRPPQP